MFLVVRKRDGAWHFPEATLKSGETIREARPGGHRAAHARHARLTNPYARQTGVRALTEAASGLDVHYMGNAPVAHHVQSSGAMKFFMRACYLGGAVEPVAGGGIAGVVP